MILTESTPILPEYPSYLEALKKTLNEDCNKKLASFCRERSIEYNKFASWLSGIAGGFTRLRQEARAAHGIPIDLNERYLKYLDLLKSELREDVNLRFMDFCERHGVNSHSMRAWLSRNCLDLTLIRAQICKEKGGEVPRKGRHPYIPIPLDGDEARARYGKTLDSYRDALKTNSSYSLKLHCKMTKTNYYDMSRW